MTLHAAISNLIQDAASSAALQLSVSCDDRHYIVEYHESGSPVGLGIHWRRFLFNIGGTIGRGAEVERRRVWGGGFSIADLKMVMHSVWFF